MTEEQIRAIARDEFFKIKIEESEKQELRDFELHEELVNRSELKRFELGRGLGETKLRYHPK